MIHLDTHVVVWLYAGELARFPSRALDLLEREPLVISPIVRLELAYLHEIGRLHPTAPEVLDDLARSIGLTFDTTSFEDVAAVASQEQTAFTRDPFDRMIAAQALAASRVGASATPSISLLTKDRNIREHVPIAVWD